MNNRTCLIALILILFQNKLQAQVQIGNDIEGEFPGDQSGWVVSMPDRYTIGIGAPTNAEVDTGVGHVRVYSWKDSIWVQKGNDIDGNQYAEFSGRTISMPDSNTIAIGSPNYSGAFSFSGRVRIFSWNGSNWIQKGPDLNGLAIYDYFGSSISMPDSNTIAVGLPDNSDLGPPLGQVKIYKWNGSNWVQKGPGIYGEAAFDHFGQSVSMADSNNVVIGARFNDGGGSNSGHVRVFHWNGTLWIQKGIDVDGEAATNQLGFSVSMPDSNTFAAGAPIDGGLYGQVKIFKWDGTNWVLKGLDIPGETSGSYCGWAVEMADSNHIAIGEPGSSTAFPYAGSIRVFMWDGNTWIQKGSNTYGEAEEDNFGFSVSMPDTSTFAGGAFANDGNGMNAGHARVYHSCFITHSTNNITACDSITWIDGLTYTSSNSTATYITNNAEGCDSIISLNLTINSSHSVTDSIFSCSPYTWIDGITYSSSNSIATFPLITTAGCDSIVNLNLIIPIIDTSVSISGDTLTSNATLVTYQWLSCDKGFAPMGEINQNFTPLTSGSYAVEVTFNSCVDTSSCHFMAVSSLNESPHSFTISLFPNPANNYLAIESEKNISGTTYNITDISGKLIKKGEIENSLTIDVRDLPNGFYFLNLKDVGNFLFQIMKN